MKYQSPFILEKFRGIYNVSASPPERTRENPGTWLRDSYNWEVDRTGLFSTRAGYASKVSGSFHSLFSTKNGIIADFNKRLCLIVPEQNYAYKILIPLTTGARWSYAKNGDTVWATNANKIGFISSGVWNDISEPTITFKKKMPAGHLLEIYRGRLYVAIDNIIVYSDPLAFHYYDIREDSSFLIRASRVTMVRSVNDGLWVSDENGISFYYGKSPLEFERIPVASTPVIFGTDARIDGITVSGNFYESAIFVSTANGIKILGEGGKIIYTSENTFSMPSAISGCATIRQDSLNQYISILR